MSDKKHIDRIFQEKLRDLEVTPNAKVWKNIQEKIEQPKKEVKKIFPLWLRLTSIAALLLVLLTIGNLFTSNKTDVVDTENAVNTSETENNSKNTNSSNSINNNNTLAEESDNTSNNEEVIVETKNASEENKSRLNTSIATSNTSDAKTNNNNSSTNNSVYNKSQNNRTSNSATGAVIKNNITTSKQNQLVNTKNNSSVNSDSERTVVNNTQSRNQNTISNKDGANVNDVNTVSSITNSERLAQNNTENRNNNTGNVTELDKNKVDFELKNNTTNAVTENQTNTEEENKTTDEETKKEEISIEEEIAKAEDLIEKEEAKKVNRWQVYASIAPVYYNTLGKGSHIDEQFDDNSKSGEINTSYGVNVSYAFNEKLKLRSGINSLNLSYDTDNVIIYENVSGGNAPALKNIDFNNEQAISAISANNLVAQQAVGLLPNENAAISQRLGYYEVPVELEYTISSKKFGVNVIAGLSTFILNDNKIYSEFEGRKTEIGEANNINNVSFSGNLGLGFDYKFSNKIKLNVQPTFKYQLNAYENTSGNFRPYIVGVYTGLSYKF